MTTATLTPKQAEYTRLFYLGGAEAIPSEPGRCKVIDSLVRLSVLDKNGLTESGKAIALRIVHSSHQR